MIGWNNLVEIERMDLSRDPEVSKATKRAIDEHGERLIEAWQPLFEQALGDAARDRLYLNCKGTNETVVIDGQYRLQQGSLVQVLHGKAAQEADLQSAVEKAIP